jgi:hypothetical protein
VEHYWDSPDLEVQTYINARCRYSTTQIAADDETPVAWQGQHIALHTPNKLND